MKVLKISLLIFLSYVVVFVPSEANVVRKIDKNRFIRSATTDRSKLWPGATVYYTVEPGYSRKQKDMMQRAFSRFHYLTCVKFVERDPLLHPDYIIIKKNKTGCSSHVGRQGGGQILSLDLLCFGLPNKLGIILKPLLQALGFFYEHNRFDRDHYIKVIAENVKPGERQNFQSYNLTDVTHLGAPYDYGSLMHGTRKMSSQNTLDTLVPTKCGGRGMELGQQDGLSHYDVVKVNKLYGCAFEQNDCIDMERSCAVAGSDACKNPATYNGIKRTTMTGRKCQRWDSQTPHQHEYRSYSGSQTNYCRNPDGVRAAPWCYTTDPKVKWEYCFPQCESGGTVRMVSKDGTLHNPFGRVEVFYNETWGTVARNPPDFSSWDSSFAKVVCRMLGWPSGYALAHESKEYGQGTGKIWLAGPRCLGSESHLEDCLLMEYEQNVNATHAQDIGVQCYCPPTDTKSAVIDLTKAQISVEGDATVKKTNLRHSRRHRAHKLDVNSKIKIKFNLQEIPYVANLHIVHPPSQYRGYPPVIVKLNGENSYLYHLENEKPAFSVDGTVLPKRHLKIGENEIVISLIRQARRIGYYPKRITLTWDV